MNDIQPDGQTEIDIKIREAETCHSMGMMHEALQVYEQVLADLPEENGPMRETIGTKITQLKKEIEDHPFTGQEESLHVTISLGVAQFDPEHDTEKSMFIKKADSALYRAKEQGRNRVIAHK